MDNVTNLSIKKEFVRKQACFSKLTDQEIEGLASLLVEKHFHTGDVIVKEGDLVDSVYLIVSGTVDIQVASVVDNKIQQKSVAKLTVGDAIGLNDTGFYSLSGKRTATVIALTEMVLLYLSITEFHGFSLSNHHVHQIMRRNAEAVLGAK